MKPGRYLSYLILLLVVCSALNYAPTTAQTESPRALSAVRSQSQFDAISRSYDPDTPYSLPHVLFVIDRKDKNRIYYVNTRRYAFHKDFVNGT